MRNADMPAMPIERLESATGLTKREHFAALAMKGFALNVQFMFNACPAGEAPADFMASQAVGLADALLDELEQPK